jgi:hypothetical protein
VLDASWDDEQVARFQVDVPGVELDGQFLAEVQEGSSWSSCLRPMVAVSAVE